jgi:NAD(P)-dependent dehydrogenase (short-subunit alcohol dehydrogenase family)
MTSRRTAIVTGASRGIGHAIALRFHADGWRVITVSRTPPPGVCPWSRERTHILLDLSDLDNVVRCIEIMRDMLGDGALDALVNNAGIAIAMPLEFIPLQELRRQLEVNVIGQIAVTQAFLPHLRRSQGRVVFVGSIAGKSALPFLGAYAASKHALEALADSLRIELRPFGVAVSLVEPGTIRTPIWKKSAALADSLADSAPADLRELYGERIAAFGRVAARRGARGAPVEAVVRAVEQALTQERPRTRRLVGRDAKLRAGVERLPDRIRDSVYERVLLR